MGVRTVDPGQKVGKIPLAERQLVEIAKVLTLRRPRILIFDEPTAALGQADVERLFRIMEGLRDEGVGIIFVSHRYREVLRICDRATVLRNGKVVGEVARGDTSVEHLVELTLGQKAAAAFQRWVRRNGSLCGCDVHVGSQSRRRPDDPARRDRDRLQPGLGSDRLARRRGRRADVTAPSSSRAWTSRLAACGLRLRIALITKTGRRRASSRTCRCARHLRDGARALRLHDAHPIGYPEGDRACGSLHRTLEDHDARPRFHRAGPERG